MIKYHDMGRLREAIDRFWGIPSDEFAAYAVQMRDTLAGNEQVVGTSYGGHHGDVEHGTIRVGTAPKTVVYDITVPRRGEPSTARRNPHPSRR